MPFSAGFLAWGSLYSKSLGPRHGEAILQTYPALLLASALVIQTGPYASLSEALALLLVNLTA